MMTYRLRLTGLLGVLLPLLVGLLVAGTGLDAVVRAGGPVAWTLLIVGAAGSLLWAQLPWAVRLVETDCDEPSLVLLAPLRRSRIPVADIESVTGSWTNGMNRWFLASVWLQRHGRTVGQPLPVGFPDPDAVRDHLHRLNPSIRMDR